MKKLIVCAAASLLFVPAALAQSVGGNSQKTHRGLVQHILSVLTSKNEAAQTEAIHDATVRGLYSLMQQYPGYAQELQFVINSERWLEELINNPDNLSEQDLALSAAYVMDELYASFKNLQNSNAQIAAKAEVLLAQSRYMWQPFGSVPAGRGGSSKGKIQVSLADVAYWLNMYYQKIGPDAHPSINIFGNAELAWFGTLH